MTLTQMQAKFPTPHECNLILAGLRWEGAPIWPYCGAGCRVPVTVGGRYHCNSCNTNFSVTAKTIFATLPTCCFYLTGSWCPSYLPEDKEITADDIFAKVAK